MNKIIIDAIIPKIALIIVNFLYNFTLYLIHNSILIINIILENFQTRNRYAIIKFPKFE
jgi:hypothetical protein